MSKKLPIFACEIDDTDDTGISAISFVDYPAVEVDFVALSKQKTKHKLHLNEDKQILTGVVLQPQQLIYRDDPQNGEYYITFSEEAIEKIARKMMRTGIALQNTTHQHQTELSGNYLTEIWIIEDPKSDKSNALGFQNLPKGTLMCSYKVEDSSYWKSEVKTGKVKGFSLEGFFYQNKINMNKKFNGNKKRNLLNSFLFSKSTTPDEEEKDEKNTKTEKSSPAPTGNIVDRDKTASGVLIFTFELADGTIIEVDTDGFATLDGEQAAAGIHELSDGNFIVIDDNGDFVETQAEGDNSNMETPNAELSFHSKRRNRNNNAQQISKLKARIARLERTPSAKPARPKEMGLSNHTTHYNRMAEVARLSMRKK